MDLACQAVRICQLPRMFKTYCLMFLTPPASSTKLLVVCPAKSSAVGINEFKMQFKKRSLEHNVMQTCACFKMSKLWPHRQSGKRQGRKKKALYKKFSHPLGLRETVDINPQPACLASFLWSAEKLCVVGLKETSSIFLPCVKTRESWSVTQWINHRQPSLYGCFSLKCDLQLFSFPKKI